LLALRRGRGDDCKCVSRSGKQLAYWTILLVTAIGLIQTGVSLSSMIVGPLVSPSLYRISPCPELVTKSGVHRDSIRQDLEHAGFTTHHSQAGIHEASVPYSDHVCASCNAGLDLSGAGPPSQHEQWRAQTRQRTGLQRVSRLVLHHCAKQHREILTNAALIVANVADVKRSSVPAKTHATLARRDNYYATSTSRIRRSSLHESQLEPSNGHDLLGSMLLTTGIIQTTSSTSKRSSAAFQQWRPSYSSRRISNQHCTHE
jgi:hypothetical protein